MIVHLERLLDELGKAGVTTGTARTQRRRI
jgi:hypothetical protein